jgi:hypothetical protein
MDTSHEDLVCAPLCISSISHKIFTGVEKFRTKAGGENKARTLCPVRCMVFEIIKQMLRWSCIQHSTTVFQTRPIILDSN